VDTTCTVWDVENAQAVTQLIAHDRAVYDVAWLPGDTNIFVSVGADGSLRAFDLRSLEHSTILYETSAAAAGASSGASPRGTSPLLRICFHPTDQNYMATFHMDGQDIQILDMRAPGQPVFELRAHRAQVNAAAFGPSDKPLLATAGPLCSSRLRCAFLMLFSSGDDCQLLLWDLAPHMAAQGQKQAPASRHGSSPRPDKAKWRTVTDPVMAYTGAAEISSLAWSPPISGGEWLAFAMGRTVKALRV
jgi:WD repeat-containing protein 68